MEPNPPPAAEAGEPIQGEGRDHGIMRDHAKERGEIWPEGSMEILLPRGTIVRVKGRDGLDVYIATPVYGMVKAPKGTVDRLRSDIRQRRCG